MATTAGKAQKCAAEWGSINAQGRLAIPVEITGCLSWFVPSKQRIEVLIDLSRPNLIIIRSLDEVAQALELGRETLIQDSETAEIGLRRLAISHHFFRNGSLIVSARRIGLKTAILDHLDTTPGGRLFCLGFADRIEAYNEQAAREIMATYGDDVLVQS